MDTMTTQIRKLFARMRWYSSSLRSYKLPSLLKPMDMETAAIRFHVYPILHGLQYTVQQINDFCHNDLMFKNKTDQHFRALQVKSCLDRNAKTSAAAFHNIGHYGKGYFRDGTIKHETMLALVCLRTTEIWLVPGGVLRHNVSGIVKIGLVSKYDKYKLRHGLTNQDRHYLQTRVYPHCDAHSDVYTQSSALLQSPGHTAFHQHLIQKAEQSNADELLCNMPSIHTATEHYWNVEGLSSHHRIEWCAREAFNQLVPKYRLMPVHGSKPYDSLLTTALQDDPSVPVKIQEKVCHQIGNAFRCRFYKTKHNKLVPYTHHDFDYMIAYLMGGWEWTNGQRQWVVNARTHLVGYWFIPINILLQRQARFPTKYFTLHASGDLYNMIGEEAHLRASWSKAYFTLIQAAGRVSFGHFFFLFFFVVLQFLYIFVVLKLKTQLRAVYLCIYISIYIFFFSCLFFFYVGGTPTAFIRAGKNTQLLLATLKKNKKQKKTTIEGWHCFGRVKHQYLVFT